MESEVKFQQIISLTTSWRLHLTSLPQNNLHSIKNYFFPPNGSYSHTNLEATRLFGCTWHGHSMSEKIFWNTTTTLNANTNNNNNNNTDVDDDNKNNGMVMFWHTYHHPRFLLDNSLDGCQKFSSHWWSTSYQKLSNHTVVSTVCIRRYRPGQRLSSFKLSVIFLE